MPPVRVLTRYSGEPLQLDTSLYPIHRNCCRRTYHGQCLGTALGSRSKRVSPAPSLSLTTSNSPDLISAAPSIFSSR